MTKLIKKTLFSEQEAKTKYDLRLIDALVKQGQKMGLRVVIHGGYATDGFLGQITRYHDDIDVEVYGTSEDAEATIDTLVNHAGTSITSGFFEFEVDEGQGKRDFYHNFVIKTGNTSLDVYYTQTKTLPFGEDKIIIKKDGSLSHQKFGKQYGKVGNISYEIQDPLTGVVDKIYKREYRGDPKFEKHEQDIENLRQVVSKKEIQAKLEELKSGV